MIKTYKTQQEVEKDIKDGVLAIEGGVKFECSISIEASIVVEVGDITAWNITARNINARNINAWNITAWNITAWNITAGDIMYYAFCSVYQSISCLSIKAKREKHQEPVCLDGKLEIRSEKPAGKRVKIKLSGGDVVEGEIVED